LIIPAVQVDLGADNGRRTAALDRVIIKNAFFHMGESGMGYGWIQAFRTEAGYERYPIFSIFVLTTRDPNQKRSKKRYFYWNENRNQTNFFRLRDNCSLHHFILFGSSKQVSVKLENIKRAN
jgi:hypothetical protein